MTLDQFYRRVAADILEQPDAIVIDDTSLGEFDSIARLQAMVILDEVFGLVADPDEIKKCKTVGDLLKMVPQ